MPLISTLSRPPFKQRGERVYRLAHGYIQEPQLRSEVKRGITIVRKVWVLQALGVVFDDAFEKGEVFE